ncbi:hypothetical protein WL883_17155 [Escherichia coli]
MNYPGRSVALPVCYRRREAAGMGRQKSADAVVVLQNRQHEGPNMINCD